MGRRKGNRKKQSTDDSDEELSEEHTIAESMTTFESIFEEIENDSIDDNDFLDAGNNDDASQTAAKQQRLEEALEGLDEYASEKRTRYREAKLRRTFKALTQYADTRYVTFDTDVIRQAAFHALRTGPSAEQYAACRVLEVTSVLLGPDEADWCASLERQLRRTIETKATVVRMAALRAMCLSVFINTALLHSDSATTEGWMDICEAVAAPVWRNDPVPAALRAAAWECWGLLASSLSDFDLAGQDEFQMGRGLAVLTNLQEALEHSEVRAAAAECVALIHQARWNTGMSDGANVTARQFHRGSWEDSDWQETIEAIQERVADLSTESGYNLSKKAKKLQRATFRELVATIVEDEDPEEVVQFRNGTQLELTSWKEIIQLNFLRQSLQGGFQNQLLTNPTLQTMFGLDGTSVNQKGNGYSPLEKRLLLSKTSEASKLSDQKRTKDRRKREHIKNDFLLND